MANIFQQIVGELCPLKGGNDNLNNLYASGRLHLNGIMAEKKSFTKNFNNFQNKFQKLCESTMIPI